MSEIIRNKPKSTYSGLCVIMSNPSRFDKQMTRPNGTSWTQLLSANGGVLFNNCLQPEFNTLQCDVRTTECKDDFLPNTKCVLLLGQTAMLDWAGKQVENNTLNEMRGSVLEVRGLPAIASYFPQDATDIRNYEQTLNTDSKEYDSGDEVSGDSEDEGDVKRFSSTRRSNYSFWLKRDVWKAKQILRLGYVPSYGKNEKGDSSTDSRSQFRIYPTADEVINSLLGTKNSFLYFDMETDYEEQNLLCFSFSFDSHCIYCVPVLDSNYRPAYSSLHLIMRALAIAIRDNTVVAHNGACFDFFVLGFKYHIPVFRCYDTMLSMHRCFPSVEKSLGHCTSYWTWERFHKDSDSQGYFTREHMMDKLKYCGKDVFTMVLIKEAIDQYATTIPGLVESIKCAQDSIVPYLLMSLQGINYDEESRAKIVKENDRLMMCYIKMMNLLIGEQGLAEIKSHIKGFKGSFVGSSKQATTYFHTLLGYPILWRSPKTGEPSLGKKLMYRLAMKYPENPMIPLILAYRKVAKETGSLNFIPWKNDDGIVYRIPKETTLL